MLLRSEDLSSNLETGGPARDLEDSCGGEAERCYFDMVEGMTGRSGYPDHAASPGHGDIHL